TSNVVRLCFFFSSRRRHTRSKRDWSSDVCSSDLLEDQLFQEYLFVDINKLVQLTSCSKRWLEEELLGDPRVRLCERRKNRKRLRSEERRVGKECRSRRWGEGERETREETEERNSG